MTTTAAPARTTTSRVPVATVVVASLAILLQLLVVLSTAYVWLVLAYALPEGWGPILVSRDELGRELREWALRSTLVAACVAAIVVAVAHRGRAATTSARAALVVAVVGLGVGLADYRIDLSGLTSWTS